MALGCPSLSAMAGLVSVYLAPVLRFEYL